MLQMMKGIFLLETCQLMISHTTIENYFLHKLTHMSHPKRFIWKKKILHSRIFKKCLLCPKDFIWVFPKIGVPQNGWFIIENPSKMGWFGGTTIFGNIHIFKTLFHKSQHLHLSTGPGCWGSGQEAFHPQVVGGFVDLKPAIGGRYTLVN